MLPEIYKIKNIGAGFIAIMAKPIGEWLDEEIRGLRQLKIDLVVSLLTPAEIYELGLSKEEMVCKTQHINFLSFPITDRGVPESRIAASAFISDLYRFALSGQGIVVHCRAGIGRSSLIAACVLLHENLSPLEALALISKVRCVPVPDTEEQVRWIEQYFDQLTRKSN